MKYGIITLLVLGLCVYLYAESKTEVVVKDGLVKTFTDKGDSLIGPGQKAVLLEDQAPLVSLNNKMVEKLLELDKMIESERNMGDVEIRHTSAQIYSIDSENEWKMGAVVTQKNMDNEPSSELRIGPSTVLRELKGFTLEGKPIQYRMEQIDEGHAYYYVYFDQPVKPGDDFKFLAITTLTDEMDEFKLIKDEMLTKHDGQWIIRNNNDTPYCLNYFQYILPKTGIFVKSDPSALAVDQQEGRVSVTVRKYVGTDGRGGFNVHFLWPAKDGTCLNGIPWTNAGTEAIDVYTMFIAENITAPELWGELAMKLVGGGYYDEAYDAFEHCYNGHGSDLWDYTALTWQGHLADIQGQREQAIAKYQQALQIKQNTGDMRHDQWSIVLSTQWLEQRIKTPFTEEMLLYPELNYRQTQPDAKIIIGKRIGGIDLGFTKEQVLDILGVPKHLFAGDQQYTLDTLPEKYCMTYSDLGFDILNNKVIEIAAFTPYYQLPGGIRVGDSEESVIQTYGTAYELKQLQTKDFLTYEELGLTFEISKPERIISEVCTFIPE